MNSRHDLPIEEAKEFADQFFANPWNRFIMNMFAVHDGEMSIKDVIGKQKVKSVK